MLCLYRMNFSPGRMRFEKIVDHSTKVPSIITGPWSRSKVTQLCCDNKYFQQIWCRILEEELKKSGKILLILIWAVREVP